MCILCHSVVLTNASSVHVSGVDNNVLFCQVCTARLFKLTFIHLLDEVQCALPYTVTLCVFWHVVSASRLQSSGCCKCLILLNIIIKQQRRQWCHGLCRALVDVSWHSDSPWLSLSHILWHFLALTLLHSLTPWHSHTLWLSLSYILTLLHSLSLSLSHSFTLFLTLSRSPTLTLTHWHFDTCSHSHILWHTLSFSHSLTLPYTLSCCNAAEFWKLLDFIDKIQRTARPECIAVVRSLSHTHTDLITYRKKFKSFEESREHAWCPTSLMMWVTEGRTRSIKALSEKCTRGGIKHMVSLNVSTMSFTSLSDNGWNYESCGWISHKSWLRYEVAFSPNIGLLQRK